MYCKNIQGCKNEVQQLNLYWFAFCIVTHTEIYQQPSLFSYRHSCSPLNRRVMIPTSDNYFSRVSTTSQKCHKEISPKTLNTFASTVNNCEVIMNTYYNHFLEGICLNTMKCHRTSPKRLSVLLYQH